MKSLTQSICESLGSQESSVRSAIDKLYKTLSSLDEEQIEVIFADDYSYVGDDVAYICGKFSEMDEDVSEFYYDSIYDIVSSFMTPGLKIANVIEEIIENLDGGKGNPRMFVKMINEVHKYAKKRIKEL